MKETVCILIGGEAGQGLVTIGDLLVKSLVRSGYYLVVTQDYQSRIRGGHNTYVIRAGGTPIGGPTETIDLMVALNEETVTLHQPQLASDGLIVMDAAFGIEVTGAWKVPYKELAEGKYFNVAALGVVAALIGLDQGIVGGALEQAFGKKHPEAAVKNAEALAKAYQWTQNQDSGDLTLPPARQQVRRLAMNGNEAIALGAMAAGVKFCAFYPMTPSTSVALTLAANAEKMGLVVEQAEDEIAAINMAIGAFYAGAPSMVTTSGGGFALMVEGVSLAAMTEIPIVIVVVQRPGPATGLPTRTEQADLEFVLHAGHGEFPRAIFAPGSIEDCFHLTRRAFGIAQNHRSPVFVLSDQFLADSYRAVEPFDLDHDLVLNPVEHHQAALKVLGPGPYLPYTLTETGTSPRLLPGLSEHLVVVDSDEHTEDGHLTEDLSVRLRMNDKRLRKLTGLTEETIPPEWFGDLEPDLLLVGWGSTLGALQETVAQMQAEGQKVAALHFSQVWPLDPDQFLDQLHKAWKVVGVEGNAQGQFCRLLRRETGFHIQDKALRYDGLPITPEYIRRNLPA